MESDAKLRAQTQKINKPESGAKWHPSPVTQSSAMSCCSSNNSGKQNTSGCLNSSGYTWGQKNSSMFLNCVKLPNAIIVSIACLGERVWGCCKRCVIMPLRPSCVACCGCCGCCVRV